MRAKKNIPAISVIAVAVRLVASEIQRGDQSMGTEL